MPHSLGVIIHWLNSTAGEEKWITQTILLTLYRHSQLPNLLMPSAKPRKADLSLWSDAVGNRTSDFRALSVCSNHYATWERFFSNQPSSKLFSPLWNFNMGVNGKVLKCSIYLKKGCPYRTKHKKLWLTPYEVHMLDIFISIFSRVCDHSVHFATFPRLRFSKGYCFHSVYPVSR